MTARSRAWPSAALVAAAGLVLAGLYIWQQRSEIRRLRDAQVKSQTVSLQNQKFCADQAKRNFVDAGWKLDGAAAGGYIASYTSHYAPAYNRCFMQLYTFGGAPTVSQEYMIVDAFENREYAHYTTQIVEKGAAPIMFECDVTLPGKVLVRCKSKDEWDQLTKPMMGGD